MQYLCMIMVSLFLMYCHEMILSCWKDSPQDRPLSDILKPLANYMDFIDMHSTVHQNLKLFTQSDEVIILAA